MGFSVVTGEAFRFGTGCVEGVIAPEAANNAKEGGAILTTVAFGVPGSAVCEPNKFI